MSRPRPASRSAPPHARARRPPSIPIQVVAAVWARTSVHRLPAASLPAVRLRATAIVTRRPPARTGVAHVRLPPRRRHTRRHRPPVRPTPATLVRGHEQSFNDAGADTQAPSGGAIAAVGAQSLPSCSDESRRPGGLPSFLICSATSSWGASVCVGAAADFAAFIYDWSVTVARGHGLASRGEPGTPACSPASSLPRLLGTAQPRSEPYTYRSRRPVPALPSRTRSRLGVRYVGVR